MNAFAYKLNTLRRDNGISQEELANKVQSTKSTISKYERGIIEPTLDVAIRIANYFDITIDSMIHDSNSTNPSYEKENSPLFYGEYADAIKFAFDNNISPDKILDMLRFAINIQEKE